MTIESKTRVRRIEGIEGLRGLLALWVVLGHTLAAAGLGEHWRGPFAVLAAGGNAVDAFIIVSGFVIFYLLDVAQESYGQFIFRRGLRLYPVYLMCILVSIPTLPLAIQVYSSAPWFHSLNLARVQIATNSLAYLPQQLTAHLFMIHSLIPDWVLPNANYAILGQAWSLSLEWQFYIIAPLILRAFTLGGRAAVVTIAIACLAHFLISGNEGVLPRHIPMFAIGIACYFLWKHDARPTWKLSMPIGIALAYLMTHSPGVVVWATVFLSAYQPRSVGSAFVCLILESRLLLMLGKWSYSIYLSHAILLVLSLFALEWIGASALGEWPFFFVLLTLTIGGTLAVSAALYQFVEAPCIALGRRRTAAAAAVKPS